jgi:hypothetical protein
MKTHPSKFITAVFILIAVMPPIAPQTFADDPAARAIMEKVDARDDGDNQTSDMEMILIDKRGKKKNSSHRRLSQRQRGGCLEADVF